MALTKAQISLVTVSTLGVAAGGYTAQLAAFNTQKEAAAFIATTGLLNEGTNAEFVNTVVKNLGLTKTDVTFASQKAAFFKALEDGTSRADAAVDFANAQLVANGKIDNVTKAAASTSTSMDLNELKAEVVQNPLTITFKDDEKDQHDTEYDGTKEVVNIGKAQIDAGAGKIANDFTFELKGQIGAGDTFTGKFLSPILDSAPPTKSGSQIVIELRNLREPADSTTPLKSLPTEGVAFKMDGVFLLVASDAIHAAQTYSELRDAFEARLAELAVGTNLPTEAGVSQDPAVYAKLVNFKATIGNSFNVQSDKGVQVSGQQIVLTDAAGSTLEPLALTNKSGIIIDTGFTLYAEVKEAEAQVDTKAITTNLDAQNVGYGSQGGSVNLVGQSNSDKGIEELKLTVKDGVWFSKLESKGAGSEGKNHLESIELQAGSNGYFRVGTQEGKGNTHVVNLKDQQFFDVTAPGTTKGAGLVDVRVVNAANAGETAINAYVSDAIIDRDYNLKDTGTFGSDNIDIAYNLSEGRDVLNLAVDQDVMESTDTQININTGAGNDVIHFQVVDGLHTNAAVAAAAGTAVGKVKDAGNTNWLANQQLLNNLKVDAGDGDDQIVMTGAGNAIVMAGTGNDEVRADNTGKKAVFVFNNKTTDIQSLLNNKDTNIASETANQSLSLFKATVKVTFQGFESEAIVIDSTNYKTSTLQINQAIKKAIADSPQLSKLLAAHDNEGHALGIESLVDGKLNLADLNIKITAPAAYKTETAAETAARKAAGQEMLAQDDLLNATKITNPTATTATVTESDLNNAANILNNDVYKAEFGTNGGSSDQQQIQTIDFKGVSTLPAGHALSGTAAELDIGGAVIKITAGMSSADIAQAAAKALSQHTLTNFVKAEAVGEQVKVYFDSNVAALTSSVTASTSMLSTKALPSSVVSITAQTGAAATAAKAGTATLDFSGVDVATSSPANGQIEVTIGTTKTLVTVAPGLGGLGLAKAVQEALNGKTATVGTDQLTITATVLDEKVTLSMTGGTANDVTIGNVTVANTSTTAGFVPATGTGLSVTGAATNYEKADSALPAARTSTLDFNGMQVTESGSITIGGISIALAKGDDDRAIADKVQKALDTKVFDGATAVATLSGTTGVTLTQNPAAGSTTLISDVSVSNITASFANTSAKPGVSFTQAYKASGNKAVTEGSDSDVESDNIINLGQGTDLVMMGTGKNSNDTLVLTGHNNGTNTVVNFDGNANSTGVDYLDLSAYVAGQNKVVLGSVNNASGTMADKAVAKASVTAAQFATLTDAEILAQLNGTADAAKQIANLKSIDATTGGTANSNYVLMVENAGNVGEYKVFHLTATAGDNKGAFANAQTVATLDFGVQTSEILVAGHYQVALTSLNTYSNFDPALVKGLTLTVTAGTQTLSAADVKILNGLTALEELTFRGTGTTTLPYGETLNVVNLTVWGGTFDVTAGTLNVTGGTTGTSGGITLNSTLKVTVDQAIALANAGTKIKSTTPTGSKLDIVVPNAEEAAKLTAGVVNKLKGLLDTTSGSVSVTGSGASAADAAGGALFETVTVGGIGALTSYNLSDTATAIAGAGSTALNAAINITATTDATAAEAKIIANATNGGTTTYSITEATAAALITIAKDATVAAKTGLAGASSITATDLGEVVTFDNLTAASAATTIDFVDNAATLALANFNTLAGSIGLTAADVITVTGVANADIATLLPKLEGENDIIAFTGGSQTLTAAELGTLTTALTTAKVALTATDTITVNTLTGASVAATAAKDVFTLATGDTGVAITGFTIADDSIKGFGAGDTAATQTLDVTTSTVIVFTGAAADATAAADALQTQNGIGGVADVGSSVATFAFVNGTTTTIFEYADTDTGTDFLATELTLVGTVTSNAALTAADFIA